MMMTWTARVLGVVAAVAACGDDGRETSDETNPVTITSATMPGPTVPMDPTEASMGSSSSSGSEGSATEGEGTTQGPSETTAVTSEGPTTTPTTPTTVDPPETSTTDDGESSTSMAMSMSDPGTTADPPKLDMGEDPDPPVCLQCALTIASMQSGTFDVMGANIFATAQLQGQVVYAFGTYGSGRFVAAADSSLPYKENTDCPIIEWLAENGGQAPSMLTFGWSPEDHGVGDWSSGGTIVSYHLPAQYVGNPALLLQDYDIVNYIEGSYQWSQDEPTQQEVQTYLDYISMGGGGYVVSEFLGYINETDIAGVNRILQPLGLLTEPVSLNWGNVDGQIDFQCFPEPQ
jgi:hypothetical protein